MNFTALSEGLLSHDGFHVISPLLVSCSCGSKNVDVALSRGDFYDDNPLLEMCCLDCGKRALDSDNSIELTFCGCAQCTEYVLRLASAEQNRPKEETVESLDG